MVPGRVRVFGVSVGVENGFVHVFRLVECNETAENRIVNRWI